MYCVTTVPPRSPVVLTIDQLVSIRRESNILVVMHTLYVTYGVLSRSASSTDSAVNKVYVLWLFCSSVVITFSALTLGFKYMNSAVNKVSVLRVLDEGPQL